jgi:hypothetical protein
MKTQFILERSFWNRKKNEIQEEGNLSAPAAQAKPTQMDDTESGKGKKDHIFCPDIQPFFFLPSWFSRFLVSREGLPLLALDIHSRGRSTLCN